jgi:WD40 repeat protein
VSSTFPTLEPRASWGPSRRAFHTLGIAAIAVSPDGEVIVSAASDGVLMWRAPPGTLPEAPHDGMRTTGSMYGAELRLAPDPTKEGNWMLVSTGPDGLEVRDLWLKLFGAVEPLKKSVKATALSADATTVTFASSTGAVELILLTGHKSAKRKIRVADVKKVTAAALSPSGKRLVLGGSVLQVASTDDGSTIATLGGASGELGTGLRLVFVNEETVVAIGETRGWCWRMGHPESTPRAFDLPCQVRAVAPSSDGALFAIAGADGVVVLDIERLSARWLTSEHTSVIAWRGSNEILATGGLEGRFRQLKLESGVSTRAECPALMPQRDWLGFKDAVMSPDDRWIAVAAAEDAMSADDPYSVRRELRIFDVETGRQTCHHEVTDDKVRTFSRPRAIASGPLELDWYDERVKLASDLQSVVETSPRSFIEAAAISADRRRMITREAEGIALRDTANGEELARFPAKPSSRGLVGTYRVAISADGSQLAVWGDTLTVHRVGEEKPFYKTSVEDAWVFIPPSFAKVVIIGERSSSGCAVNLSTRDTTQWHHHGERKGAAAISPDGRFVVIDEGDVRQIVLRRANDGEKIAALRGLWSSPSRFLFTSSSESIIAVCYDGFMVRWDVPSTVR